MFELCGLWIEFRFCSATQMQRIPSFNCYVILFHNVSVFMPQNDIFVLHLGLNNTIDRTTLKTRKPPVRKRSFSFARKTLSLICCEKNATAG